MAPPSLSGLTTALVTPFRAGAVDFDALARLVERQIAAGVGAISPCGTTGESPTLTHDEHIEVVREVVRLAAGRVPVVAGSGSNATAEAVSLTRRAEAAGADALLVVAPYYNRPTQEGLFHHFDAVARATARPVMLYSIPGRCGIEIGVETVARLRERHAHVAWIKEAGGSVDRVDQLRERLGDAVTILSGDDALTLPFMAVGAQGVVSVASNLAPAEMAALVAAAGAGDLPAARARHARLYPLFKALFLEPNPVPVKHALQRAGLLPEAEVRPPLCALAPATRAALEGVLDRLGPLA